MVRYLYMISSTRKNSNNPLLINYLLFAIITCSKDIKNLNHKKFFFYS